MDHAVGHFGNHGVVRDDDGGRLHVGGTVRDALLGRDIHDIDLLVAEGAIPLTFRLADALGSPAYVLDAERDIGRILVANEAMTLDVARFRGSSLEDDLRDRDFTMNALALPVDLQSGDLDNIIDQHEGIHDLQARRIRIIHARSISDDPVRALRAARFAVQLGFDMTDGTMAAAQAVAPVLLDRVSPERIRDELSRLLATEAPHEGVAQLDQLGLLTVVLPEIAALDGVAQPLPHHEDVLRHTMSVLRYLVQIESIVEELRTPGAEPTAGLGVRDRAVGERDGAAARGGERAAEKRCPA